MRCPGRLADVAAAPAGADEQEAGAQAKVRVRRSGRGIELARRRQGHREVACPLLGEQLSDPVPVGRHAVAVDADRDLLALGEHHGPARVVRIDEDGEDVRVARVELDGDDLRAVRRDERVQHMPRGGVDAGKPPGPCLSSSRRR